MPDALARIKAELGADAVILGTRTLPAGTIGGLVGKTTVEITAAPADTFGAVSPAPRLKPRIAIDSCASGRAVAPLNGEARRQPSADALKQVPRSAAPAPPPAPSAKPMAVPEELLPYYTRLVQSEFGEQLAARLIQQATMLTGGDRDPHRTRATICRMIASMIPVAGGIELREGECRRVALIGPPGAGKTTTLAKLAAHFRLRLRKRVAVVSLDMHRLANHDQIRRYAELIGVPVFTAQSAARVREILRDLPASDLVLIDSHGVSPRESGRFARLAVLLRAAKPDETHVVLPASSAPAVHAQMCDAFAPLGISRVMLTRLDEVLGLGVVLSAVQRIKWGISYVCDGQNVPANLEEACGTRVAERILPPLQ